jgi:calcium/calmodulin-dependent protein kinase I
MNGKEALENEISIMRSLQHKNILGIHSVHETENLVYLIVEHMDGGTLEDYMRSRLHLTGEEIVKIIKQILSALDYLDSKSIMHRDLKPSNIMQRKDTGDWVLTDFGLAARANTNYLYQKCGTPGFIAPEILRLEKPE